MQHGATPWQRPFLVAFLLAWVAGQGQAEPADSATPRPATTVGMPGKIEQLVLPGSELEVMPLDDRHAPLVLRITEAYAHGHAFRYDMVFYGLEPGQYDLRAYLRRKDGSPLGELPAILVTVSPLLPPGQIEPNAIALERSPWLGGYRLLVGLIGSLWCAGLAAILLFGRRKRTIAEARTSRSMTLGDRLRPLVEAAGKGTLAEGQHAELERLLIGYWRKRLRLEHASPVDVMRTLHGHPEAGPLLHQLELWLHQPGGHVDPASISEWLRPYQDLPDEDPPQEAIAVASDRSSRGGEELP